LLLAAEGGSLIRVIELKTRMAEKPVEGAALQNQLRQASMQALAVACACEFYPQIRVEPVLVRAHVPGELNLMGGGRPSNTDCTIGPTITHLQSDAARGILADIIHDNASDDDNPTFAVLGVDDKGDVQMETQYTGILEVLCTLLRGRKTSRGREVQNLAGGGLNATTFFQQNPNLAKTVGMHFFGL